MRSLAHWLTKQYLPGGEKNQKTDAGEYNTFQKFFRVVIITDIFNYAFKNDSNFIVLSETYKFAIMLILTANGN